MYYEYDEREVIRISPIVIKLYKFNNLGKKWIKYLSNTKTKLEELQKIRLLHMDNLNGDFKQNGSPPVFEQGKLVFKCIMYMMKVGAN